MSTEKLYVARESGLAVVEKLKRFSTFKSLHIEATHISVTPSLITAGSLDQLETSLRKHSAVRITTVTFTMRKLPNRSDTPQVIYNAEDDFSATIDLANLQAVPDEDKLIILEAIETIFTIQDKATIVLDSLPDTVQTQVEAHLSATRSLQSAASEIARHHAAKVAEFDDYWRRKHEELDNLDEERKRIHEEREQASNNRIKEGWANLKAERDKFQLVESRGVRRKLLNKLRAVITYQKNFKTSASLFRKNLGVYFVSLSSLAVGICLIAYSLFFANASATRWPVSTDTVTSTPARPEPTTLDAVQLYVPLASGTLITASTLAFLIR
ncbi:MAG: hypothetical protein O2945_20570 [Planctomycetota bacterium]|nr:hypothetical protein [Planctomycetota bacterium]MDA1163822.1 hypothetical protein [Planctomycetota bacterium]